MEALENAEILQKKETSNVVVDTISNIGAWGMNKLFRKPK